MPESAPRVELIDIKKIIPNPLNPRITIDEEPLKHMAETITAIGLLQPITVRAKNDKYEIIQGERRWRASRLAGLKQIPAIVKDVDDSRMMLESFIENVQREDLKPIEKAKGLAEVYHLSVGPGFEPGKLKSIEDKVVGRTKTALTSEERHIKEVADMIGLSYDYQYRLLTQLRLTSKEQERVTELELGYEKITSIATIEEPKLRERVIEVAPDLKREEVKTLSKVIREGPEEVVRAVLKPKSRITPTVADRLLKLPAEEQASIIKHVETRRLDENEAIAHIEALTKGELPEAAFVQPTLEVPLADQYQQQRIWNLSQLVGADLSKRTGPFHFDVITVGFSQKTLDELLEGLRAAQVELLVDIRKNPVSQYRPEFNKETLSKKLATVGIAYRHMPELGVPRELRNEALTGKMTAEALFDLYDRQILTASAMAELEKTIAGKRVVALLCTEVSPKFCHRHRVALALKKRGKLCYDL